MRANIALAIAAAGVILAACGGNDSCPTQGANVQGTSCAFPAPQQVVVRVNLACQPCSHTDATCTPDLHAAGSGGPNSGDIFLDTKWNICTDNSSCSTSQSCPLVTCQFTVPSGTYHVHALDQTGNLADMFTLDTTSATPSCG
jgi:hypothetical protein